MSIFKSKADVIIYKKLHQTYIDKEFELIKQNYEIYFKIDDQKLLLLAQWNDKIYSINNEVYQSILLTTHEGDFLLHFINNQDYTHVKDWFDQMNVHHVNLTVKYLINPKSCELYTTKDITLIRNESTIYLELNGQKLKLKENSFQQVPHISNVIALYTKDDDFLLIFDKEAELNAFLFWIAKEPFLSELQERADLI